jgi:UDPglucose 6-dehydrogenase
VPEFEEIPSAMQIAIIGTGHVGLVTGTGFADLGNTVTCVDRDSGKIEALSNGEIQIFEPGLLAKVRRNHSRGRLEFTTDLQQAVRDSLILMVTVGTPLSPHGEADLSALFEVADQIGAALNGYKAIVIKSTVPSGTGREVRRRIAAASEGRFGFDVCANPEFLREGTALEDFMKPSRLVIGVESPQARAILEDLYRPLTSQGIPMVSTNVETAEVIKYASNAFLVTKLSFINEVAHLCEKVGADVTQVARGMGMDQRIGPRFLRAGPGFGGNRGLAFAGLGRAHGRPLQILEAAIATNKGMAIKVRERVHSLLGGVFQGVRVGVLGLAYKPDSDDVADSVALPVLKDLLDRGVVVQAYDPQANENAQAVLPEVNYGNSVEEAVEQVDLVLLFTEWNQFQALNWEQLKLRMAKPRVLDFRSLYAPARMQTLGIEYHSLGRA